MDLKQCATRAELKRFVESNRIQQAECAKKIRDISLGVRANHRYEEVNSARTRLRDGTLVASEALSALLKTAAQASTEISERVQEKQIAWRRANEALGYVDQVLSLKRSIVAMHEAMEEQDWDRAAAYASEARSIPKEITEGSFAERMVPTIDLPDPPAQAIQANCDDLAALFSREFDKATQSRQMAVLTRYFKLFPLVGHEQTGLEKYSKFICQIIAGYGRTLLVGDEVDYGVAMSRLLEHVAAIVNQHSPLIERHYGEQAMTVVVNSIQNEVDKQAGLIIDTLWDERRLDRLLEECKAYSFPVLVHSFAKDSTPTMRSGTPQLPSSVDLVSTSKCIAELAILLNRWHLYCDFISQWSSQTLESKTQESVRSMVGPMYSALAVFVFRRSVEKAVELDEMPSHQEHTDEQPLVSSMVDDVMYVFGSLLTQAVSTGVPEARNRAITGFRRVLEADYVGTLQRHLRDAAESLKTMPLPFFVYLNTVEVTALYVTQALAKFDGEFNDFSDGFRHRSSELLTDGCQTLNALLVAPQARQACAIAFKSVSAGYILDSTQPETRMAIQFEVQWRQLVRPLRKQLQHTVFDRAIELSAATVAAALEKFVWSLKGKINELGAISLDRDVSRVITVVSESKYSLRQSFVRVAQMVTILSDDGDTATALTGDEVTTLKNLKI